MRAVVIEEPGGPDVLKVRDVPDPVPSPGEVVITTRRRRGQPGRPHAATGLVPAAAGRAAVPRAWNARARSRP